MTKTSASRAAESGDTSSRAHYLGLIEQSNAARAAGQHSEAQRLASAAHKWSMDERVRLQRLDQAIANLDSAWTHLNKAWDKDRSCGSVTELGEQHPEFLRLITRCQALEAQVELLRGVNPPAGAPVDDTSATRGWRAPRPEGSRGV